MSESILGNLSWQFSNPDGPIYDNTRDSVLEFWPAGYTQKFLRSSLVIEGAAEMVNRQEFFKQLYEEAEDLGKEDCLFPFSGHEYSIDFVPEPENRYDPFALRIEMTIPAMDWVNGYHIGYVPAKINKNLLANKERITDVQILMMTATLNERFYCMKIGVGYNGTILNEINQKTLKRFQRLR